MIELILVVCLAGDPQTCREERPPIEAPASAMACMVQGQQIAAQWVEEHPKWKLSAWKCQSSNGRKAEGA